MSLQKLITNYADYNVWANTTLINWLSKKPVDVFHKEVPSSFPSLLKTLNHILATEEFWYSVISETELQSHRYGATELHLEDVLESLAACSQQLAGYIASLSDSDLQQEVFLDTPWVKGRLPRYEFIQHLFNHSTYHRGQVTSMGHNIDLHDAPMTDYNYFNMVAKIAVEA